MRLWYPSSLLCLCLLASNAWCQSSPTSANSLVGQPTVKSTQNNTPIPSPGNTQNGVVRISLAEALRLAQERSFVSQQYDAHVAGASARLTGAGRMLNPVFSIAGHFGQDTGGTDEDYLLSQSFELGDKRNQRIRAARAERDSANADRANAINELRFSVQSAYFEAQRADAEWQLAQTALDNTKKFAEAARIQFQAGDVARSQVTRSRIEQNRAEQALSVAEAERNNRFATLRSLLHITDSDTNSNTNKFALDTEIPFLPTSYKLPELATYALQHRADLRSAEATLANKRALLHSARAQTQPDLFLEARHANIDPTIGGNTIRIGLLFPLLDYGRIRADSSSAQAAVTEQEAILAESRRLALLDVETAYRNLEQARRTVESFRSGRLDDSKELVDQAQIGYARGANSFLELIDAQQVYRAEQTDYTRALTAYNIALAALQKAVGGQLPGKIQ